MLQNAAIAFDLTAAPVAAKAAVTATIVVPCHNEAKRLDAQAFDAYLAATPGVRFLFVNDGSTDATEFVLAGIKRRNPALVDVLSLDVNRGKAEAVRLGLLRAIDSGADVIGYWDADLATPLEAIGDFLRVAGRLDGVDVIFGSRRPMLGHRINRTLGRRIISRTCATLARVALALPIADTQCGAKVLRVSDALRDALAEPFRAGWLFDVELFSRLRRRDGRDAQRFYELPLLEWTEVPGSKVSSRAIVRAGVAMLKLIAANRLMPAAA